MRSLLLLCVALALCGCESISQRNWAASTKTDPFTDITTKTVSANVASGVYGWNKLSLFVSTRTNELIVGVSSSIGLPVGTVQLRIDDNPMWTISLDETPIYMAPSLPQSGLINTNIQADAMANMSKIMSPFTAVSGEKAQKIVDEMIRGKVIIYRTVGINQSASTTGRIPLDRSFVESLNQIGLSTNAPAINKPLQDNQLNAEAKR